MSPTDAAALDALRTLVAWLGAHAAPRAEQHFTAAKDFEGSTGFTRRQVEDAIRARRLFAVKVKRGYAVAADELARWAAERTRQPKTRARATPPRRAANDDAAALLAAAGFVPGGR